MRTPKCPKCSQPMEEGFIVDHTHMGLLQAEWVEGAPKWSFWTGVRIGGETDRRKVATYCCPKCGFLESYVEMEAE